MKRPAPAVLVVDDDPAIRLLCRVNLELDGFDVREAATVEAARAEVADRRPDVVLLDVHLGGADSRALLTELRDAGIPVAVVTGSADADDFSAQADAVLAKPFLPEALVATARQVASLPAS